MAFISLERAFYLLLVGVYRNVYKNEKLIYAFLSCCFDSFL